MKTGKPLILYYPELDWKPQFASMLPGGVGYLTPSGNTVLYGPRPAADSGSTPEALQKKTAKPRKIYTPDMTTAGERRLLREWYGLFK